MTPPALGTYRILRSLELPAGVLRRISIAATGKPDFGALTDDEFDAVHGAIRRARPHLYDDLGRLKDG